MSGHEVRDWIALVIAAIVAGERVYDRRTNRRK